MPTSRQVLIYVCGTGAEIDRQLSDAYQVCERRGYHIVAVFRELPGATTRWHEANRMLRHGQADQIIVASVLNVPDLLESATGALPGPRFWQGVARRATQRRRIRPVPRPDGGA
jgi:hypothetical protein